MLSDLRLAWRALVARPALAATALATFIVGIGATTAMYSVVDGVLLRPLPFDQPDRIVRIFEVHPGSGSTERRRWMSSVTLDAWLPRTPAVAAIARYSAGIDTVGRERPERLASGAVTASLFAVLGARPLLGRPFSPDDEQEGAHRVVILSYALWQSRFGGEPAAVGQTLVVNGEPHQIVGVMPGTFAFPTRDQAFWRPNVTRPLARDGRQFRVEYAIARLADGVAAEQAAQEGTTIARAQARPMAADLLFGKGGPVQVHAVPLAEEMTATVRPVLLVASAGVAMVLMLACANVANLFLSRGVSRQRELAVRAALGASRGRLMRQAMAEGLLLSVPGGVLGVALAWSLLRIFPAVAPTGFPRLDEVGLHWRVLVVSLAVSLAAGALAALAPAWRAARASATSLHDGDRRSTGAAGGRTARCAADGGGGPRGDAARRRGAVRPESDAVEPGGWRLRTCGRLDGGARVSGWRQRRRRRDAPRGRGARGGAGATRRDGGGQRQHGAVVPDQRAAGVHVAGRGDRWPEGDSPGVVVGRDPGLHGGDWPATEGGPLPPALRRGRRDAGVPRERGVRASGTGTMASRWSGVSTPVCCMRRARSRT